MQVGDRSDAEATDSWPAAHDAASLTLEGRGLVYGPSERILPLAWICATYDLLGRLRGPTQGTRLVWLH